MLKLCGLQSVSFGLVWKISVSFSTVFVDQETLLTKLIEMGHINLDHTNQQLEIFDEISDEKKVHRVFI